MNKRESRRAAKIYALANTYHSLETSDPPTEPQMAVKELAVEWARAELEKLGLQPCELLSLDDSIAAAMSSNRGYAAARRTISQEGINDVYRPHQEPTNCLMGRAGKARGHGDPRGDDRA